MRDSEVAGPTVVRRGEWRTKIQQIFDPATRTLSRRLYTVWDPVPARDLDFTWTPDQPASDKPGKINGAGLLIWRLKDRPSYDRSAIVAQYRGYFRKGRVEGRGAYLDNTGLYYEGEWKAGLIHGQGTLKLPGSDEYVGQFHVGTANGVGRLIDVTGEIYEGPFEHGLRHGRGTTTLPNGRTYTSLWEKGTESETSRLIRLAQGPGARIPGSADDIRIGITVDKRLPLSSRTDDPDLQQGDLWYSIFNAKNGLIIRPDNKRLMQMWKEGGEIQLLPDEGSKQFESFGVFSLVRGQLVPLNLNIEVQNRSSNRLKIAGIYISINSSIIDSQPAIQISEESAFGRTEYEDYYYHPFYFVENFGWSDGKEAKVQFSFNHSSSSKETTAIKTNSLGTIERSVKIDFEPHLRDAGVDLNVLKRNAAEGFPCRGNSKKSCLNEVKATGAFGSLTDLLSLSDTDIVIGVTGKLDYVWSDNLGRAQKTTSPFRIKLRLGALKQESEEGEGGSREIVTTKTQRLGLDKSDYRIPISYQTTVNGGRTARLVLPIDAEQSSKHDFKIVIQLADGREISSRPINLLYYRPRWFADYNLEQPVADEFTAENYDIVGGDLRQIRNISIGDCENACEAEPGCRACSADKWNRWCFLKSVPTLMRFDPQYITWLKKGTQGLSKADAPTSIERYRNKAFPGFGYLIYQQTDFEECAMRFADQLGGHFRSGPDWRPARSGPIDATKSRFVGEHDAQTATPPGGGAAGFVHSMRKAVFLKASCAARWRLG